MFGDDVDTAEEQDYDDEEQDDEMTEKMKRARHDGEEEFEVEDTDELWDVFEEVKDDDDE